MNVTPEDLQNIFYSGFSVSTSWQVLDELFAAIGRNAIVYRKEQLVPKEEFYAVRSSVSDIEGLGPQEKGHMALKEIGKLWLWQQHHVRSACEEYFVGLHPDVLSKDHRFVIECGTTDPSCVQIFLNSPVVLWVANIPYPFSEDKNLTIHIFARGPKYETWQQEKVDIARMSFQKFHRK